MSDKYVTLLGAEQVMSAARQISASAEGFSRAVSFMDDLFRRQHAFLDDWLTRYQAVVEGGSSDEPFREWTHGCDAVLNNVTLWIARCPRCGRPRPEVDRP